jgi:hypothetical protein
MTRSVLTRRVHRCLILGGAVLSLLWLAHFVAMAIIAPGELRAGLKLNVGSVRSLYPGELRVRAVELASRTLPRADGRARAARCSRASSTARAAPCRCRHRAS